MKRIYCEIKKCLACRSCELACASSHSQSTDLKDAINEKKLAKYRICVESIKEKGSHNLDQALALQCRHCDEPLCVQACISGGIYKDEKTGNILINTEKCVACWSCIMVCPFGAILKNEDQKIATKCDHCASLDKPACVNACLTGALSFTSEDKLEKTKP